MTRDEVKSVMADSMRAKQGQYLSYAEIANAVLAALASAGLVIGTEEPELTVDERERLGYYVNPDNHFDITVDDLYKITEKMGLALVRVVPNE